MVTQKQVAAMIMLVVAAGIVFAAWNLDINQWIVGGLGAGVGFLLGGPIGAIIGALGGALVASFGIKILGVLLGAWTALLAIAVLVSSEERTMWIVMFWFFSLLFIINIFVPDPIPFIDEIFLGLATAFTGTRSLVKNDKKSIQFTF